MSDYQCWFCGSGIARSDACAVLITIEGLWRYDADVRGEDDPVQNVYAHSRCARDRLKGSRMDLHPEMFAEPD